PTSTTLFYTLSLHDALPIYTLHLLNESNPISGFQRVVYGSFWPVKKIGFPPMPIDWWWIQQELRLPRISQLLSSTGYQHCCNWLDRKSTRLNSSHVKISYAV